MKSLKKFIFSLFVFTCTINELYAAACCGGSLSRPSLITGDEKYKIQIGYSQNKLDRDVTATGQWKKRENAETLTTYRLDSSIKFKKHFSFGATIPILTRSKDIQGAKKSDTGLSDISLSLGYEFLPEWNYHPYRPNGYLYLQATLPTGKSLYEATNSGLDTRGKGQWNTGIGVLLLKKKTYFDFSLSAELHRTFNKTIERSDLGSVLDIKPRLGGSITPEIGLSIKDFRLGIEMLFFYEEGQKISFNNRTTKSSPERYTQIAASLSYMFNQKYAVTINYSDQTQFESPLNTPLGRVWGLSFTTRGY